MKKLGKLFLALGIIVAFAGCKKPTDEITELTKIEITNQADKLEYVIGQELDTTGLEVTATYSDETKKVVTGWTTSGYDKTKSGEQTVTVLYTESKVTVNTTYTVTVKNVTLEKIEITAAPTKTKYYIGDSLDTTGLEITATYNDGTTVDVTKDVTITGFDSSAVAESQTITVTYQEQTVTFSVQIVGLKEIQITKPATNNKVYQYQLPDTTDLEISAVYTDGTTKVLETDKYTVECDSSNLSTNAVTIKYGDKTVNYTVQIIALSDINITTLPNKTEYHIGDEFDFTGMEVKAIYSDTETKVIAPQACTLTGFNTSAYTETQTVTFTYYGKAKTLTISVVFNWYETPVTLPAGTDGTFGTEGTYVYFGLWPQDVVPVDDVTTLGLETSTDKVTRGYMEFVKGSDGNYYVKCAEKAFASGYKYNKDNSDVGQGGTTSRWFKVMPIKWRVVDTEYDVDGTNGNSTAKLLVAENILTANVPYYNFGNSSRTRTVGTKNGIYPNNYEFSQIRAYLNGLDYYYDTSDTETTIKNTYTNKGFLQTAFTSEAIKNILTTEVNNSGESTTDVGKNLYWANGKQADGITDSGELDFTCENTQDKIFLLSVYEVTKYSKSTEPYNNSGPGNSHIRVTTDFAKANCAGQSTTNGYGGYYWLRSPLYCYSSFAHYVDCDGYAVKSGTISVTPRGVTIVGVVPALSISF